MLSFELAMRDIIFPIVIVEDDTSGMRMVQFLGTGFLIGSKGYGLTAAHVIETKLGRGQFFCGMFVDNGTGTWKGWKIEICDIHPSEDVALLHLIDAPIPAQAFQVTFDKHFSSAQYHLFGYPEANLYEDADVRDTTGKVLGRPDLIYSSGHIRRRVSFSIPRIRGKCFYELSQPVGTGCSGSPVFLQKNSTMQVIGIYVADKTTSITFEAYDKELKWAIQSFELPGGLSYAVRMDDLGDWQPRKLGTTLAKAP